MDFDDIVKIVDQVKVLEARLAAVEAERDAARAEAEARVKQNETQIRIHFQNTREWKEALKKAQAAEARAVEALRRCHEGAARQLAEPRDHDDDQYALTAIATDCEAVLAAQGPALDWLAQQRREAVAAWIEKEATKCRQQNGEYYDRGVDCMLREAAALRAGRWGMTNEQKAARLEEMAVSQDRLSVVLFPADSRKALTDAALLREAAAMMRERGESGWAAQFEREYKGKTLAVVEAGPIGWYWYVDGSADYEAEIAPTLAAAQAAAVAWVDEQEGE